MRLSPNGLVKLYYATMLRSGESVPHTYYHVKSAEEVFLASGAVMMYRMRIILATKDHSVLPGSELCHVIKLT